jgi:D-glycero-D-manno-heptose 1,7-bisphosphate phosphatase
MKKKTLFLDRDGIINIDHGYVYRVEDFEFAEGIFEFLELFIEAGYRLFIVTNQSGIGRGYYSDKDFTVLTKWMLLEFEKRGIHIESVHYCNHAPEENCLCRKPQTGMVKAILLENSIDLKNSWLIGDKQSDIDLAHNANIAHTIAIGDRPIQKMEFSFKTIREAQRYLEENKAIIQS